MHLTAVVWLCSAIAQADAAPADPLRTLAPATANLQAPASPALASPSLDSPRSAPAANTERVEQPARGRSVFRDLAAPAADQRPELPARRVADNEAPASLQPEDPAKLMLRQTLNPASPDVLPGAPLTLRQALDRSVGTAHQLRSVLAYWRVSQATAAYYLSLEEARFLENLPVQAADRQSARLRAAQATAKATAADDHLAAVDGQHELSEVAQLAASELPLPTDLPFSGAYQTYFESLSARGVASPQLRRLDQRLPRLRELLEAHAAAVFAHQGALTELQTEYRDGRTSLAALLEGTDRLREARRKFLSAVRDYNETIAQYALAVATPLPVTTDRIVGMLIENPAQEHSVLRGKRPNGIQRASHDEEIRRPATHP